MRRLLRNGLGENKYYRNKTNISSMLKGIGFFEAVKKYNMPTWKPLRVAEPALQIEPTRNQQLMNRFTSLYCLPKRSHSVQCLTRSLLSRRTSSFQAQIGHSTKTDQIPLRITVSKPVPTSQTVTTRYNLKYLDHPVTCHIFCQAFDALWEESAPLFALLGAQIQATPDPQPLLDTYYDLYVGVIESVYATKSLARI
jgi:hypothetical protein